MPAERTPCGEGMLVLGVMMTGRAARRAKGRAYGSDREGGPLAQRPYTLFYTAAADDIMGKRVCHGSTELLGYTGSPRTAAPDFWASMIHPEDRLRVIKEMSAILRTGSLSAEYRLLCADGSCRWVLDGAVLLRDGNGVPREIVGAIHDITSRRQLDEGIWEHELFLETLLESASKGLFVLDEGTNLVYLTKPLEALLGLGPGDWVKGDARLKMHPADRGPARDRILRALGGRPCTCKLRVGAASGTYLGLVIDLSPVKWHDHDLVLGVVTGIRPPRPATIASPAPANAAPRPCGRRPGEGPANSTAFNIRKR